MALVEALAAVGQAIEVAKAMRAVEKNIDAATYKMQIADLMTALSDARIELVAAREAGLVQDAEFERLLETLVGQADLVQSRGGFKYRAIDGKPSGLPVCPTCEQRDGRLAFTVKDGTARKVRCPVCEARFDGVAIYSQAADDEPQTLEQDEARRQAEGMAELNRKFAELGRR